MKKKDLKVIRKKNFDKPVKKFRFNRLAKIKMRRFSRRLYLRLEILLKLKRNFNYKYSIVSKYFNYFKYMVNKKEFFFFKNLFLRLNFDEKNFLFNPLFNFEKQFLFQNVDYSNLIFENNSSSLFFKKNYGLVNSTGLNYWVKTDKVISNLDPKNPVFFEKYDMHYILKNNFINDFILFQYNINKNIFFFLLIDLYKFLILLFLNKSFN